MATQSPFSFLENLVQRIAAGPQPPQWMVHEVQQRVVLLLNHVLMQEREAMGRLLGQSGRVARVQQRSDLHWLIPLLVRESRQVMDARARSESDVRSFMQTGLAAEHHRVGQLVQQVLHAALALDWSRQALRRTPADWAPVALAFAQGNHQIKPLDRLVYSAATDTPQPALCFDEQPARLDDMDDAFWAAFDTLDEAALLEKTAAVLADHPDGLHWPDLVRALPPEQDLQTLAVWLDAALHGGADAQTAARVQVPVNLQDGAEWRFDLPDIPFTPAALQRARSDALAAEEGR